MSTAAALGSVPCGRCGTALRPGAIGMTRCVCGMDQEVIRFQPFRRPPRVTAVALVPGTPCAYHSGNLAVASCGRCGSFLCDLCATPVSGDTYCTQCFERIRREGTSGALKNQFPRPHAVAVVLGFLGLIPPFGVLVAPLVGWQMFSAIRRRRELEEREAWLMVYVVAAGFLALGGLFVMYLVFGRPGR
jgi:hypothetical protein